jgi:hypothetical protein
MDFWNIANATIHQARLCLELSHTYPDELDLHITRLQCIRTILGTFREAHGVIAENDPNIEAWITGIDDLLEPFLEIQEQSQEASATRRSDSRNQVLLNIIDTERSDTGGRPFIVYRYKRCSYSVEHGI